jgi:RNA polymerase sigma-70 factor, ECF subfamily
VTRHALTPKLDASAGDTFTRFYHEHAPRVYMLALRLCRDATDASEVLSETFVRAWRGLDGFRGDSSPNTWLHTIAVRVWRDLRRTRGRPMVSLDEETIESLHSQQYGIAAQYDGGDHRSDIEEAIASVPDGAREVLILFGIEGYSHAEIASMLGISVGTVKSQLHRARKLVLERLDR